MRSRRDSRPRALSLALALALGACGDRASDARLPEARRLLAPYGLVPAVAATAVADLRWQAPDAACVHAYRIEVTYTPALRFEPDSTSLLLMGTDGGLDPHETTFTSGRLFYRGVRAETYGLARPFRVSAEFMGPAAPTAACLAQTWDPIDDALALGWPRLPDRLTAVDERWPGLRVGGKCNPSACVDPETGAGGPENHHRACVTQPWQESLAGLYEVGGERVALISSTWTDGHTDPARGGDVGVWSERRALVSLTHGRPLVVEFVLHHGFGQPVVGGFAAVERRYRLTAIDGCPGSLAALGWARPAEIVSAADPSPLLSIEGSRSSVPAARSLVSHPRDRSPG